MRIQLAVCAGMLALGLAQSVRADAPVVIKDRQIDSSLVLKEPMDYVLQNVSLTHLHDEAALTLSGQINSVTLQNCQFGSITAGSRGKAAALVATGAVVQNLRATDSKFFDAENQLVSLRDGSFGTVTFLHCTFRTSDEFLRRVYERNPWRHDPPVTEFYNIDRLELLDNDYTNTTIVIHPSVKTVVFRGEISRLQVESPETQVIRLVPTQAPDEIGAATALCAAQPPAPPADAKREPTQMACAKGR